MSQSAMINKPLGRGLASLLGPELSPQASNHKSLEVIVQKISIGEIIPGRYQPRDNFDRFTLDSLIASIREKGVIQPILVRPIHNGLAHYEIVAGERRWRAAKEVGMTEIPVLIREMTDREALETGLIENIQRHDLNPLEEAQGFKRLMEEFHHTQEDLARALGKSRSHIANSIRLLSLPSKVKEALREGKISVGHARALINTPFPERALAQILEEELSVRQTEKIAQGKARTSSSKKINLLAKTQNDYDIQLLVQKLIDKLGLKVSLDMKSQKEGALVIHFKELQELDSLLAHFSVKEG